MPNDSPNVLSPQPDGPLRVTGDIKIVTDEGATVFVGDETWLCRCGHSRTKPFCDGSHTAAGLQDPGMLLRSARPAESPGTGQLIIILRPNGPLRMDGPYILEGADGTRSECAEKGSLCRCGLSETKPMCDGAHKGSDFEA